MNNKSVLFGRAQQLSRRVVSDASAELVSLDLPASRDVTIYLNDPALMREFDLAEHEYQVIVGNGGTTFTRQVVASLRGTALHVVASQVIVRATPRVQVQSELPLRVWAVAGFGSPTAQQYRRALPYSSSEVADEVTSAKTFELSPFATHAQLVFDADDSGDTSDKVTVNENAVTQDAVYPLSSSSADRYALQRALHPRANSITVVNSNANPVRVSLIETVYC